MSDDNDAYIRAAVSRDSRFRDLQDAIAVSADMSDNPTVKALLAAFRADADLAMLEMADTSPADQKAMALISVRVGVYVRAKRILEAVLTRGRLAESDLRAQDVSRMSDE